jgi:uncharacterized protein YcbK (DUF882 family)
MIRALVTTVLSIILLGTNTLMGQSLKGTGSKVKEAYNSAKDHDYTFLRTGKDVRRFANLGYLLRLTGNGDYRVNDGVTFPLVRLETRMFVQRFASQRPSGCGKVVVTSGTRPINSQPSNASKLSVHPTGMAVDFRIPPPGKCRDWMESTFRTLRVAGVIIPTKERKPPHYHVVVLSKPYADYVAAKTATPTKSPATSTTYRVRRGDTLLAIALRHGTTVTRLKQLNKLRSNTIRVGQVLNLPRK